MRDENDPREADRFAMSNSPEDAHRLAVIASRNNSGGSRGNRDALTPEELQEWAEQAQQAAQLARERYVALRQLREAEEAAGVAERRAQRAETPCVVCRSVSKRAVSTLANHGRRTGRHVEVDGDAWAVVKPDATARGVTVAAAVGSLVASSVTNGIPNGDKTGNGDQVDGRKAQRYARLFVDDDRWTAFRAAAIDAAVSTARGVGLVVEAEARKLGWSPTNGHRTRCSGW